MKVSIFQITLLFLFKISIAFEETEENKYFKIKTESENYNLYSLAKNKNQYKFLNIQIIFSNILSSNSYISLLDENNKTLFQTDVVSTRNFIINIEEHVESILTFNATSPEMYVQYQYIEKNKDLILPSGKIYDLNLNTNSISFGLIPVLNNTETKYDLYYLGKNNYNNTYEKFIFSLNNQPIGSIKQNITNKSNLNFNEIQNDIGYYFIKGNNINELSYTYFYESILINISNTIDNVFFYITKKSNVYSFYNINDTNKNNFLNFQIFTKQKNDYSNFILLNEKNESICNLIINNEKQFQIDIKSQNKVKMKTNSTQILIQYQYIEKNPGLSEIKGKLISIDSRTNDNSINFEITPINNYSNTTYELYFSKENISNETYDKLEYSLNHAPISTITIFGIEKVILNFKYNITSDKEITEKGFAFIKAKNINETNYIYFYGIVEASIHYTTTDNSNSRKTLLIIIIIIISLLLILTVLFVLRSKNIICKKELTVNIDEELIEKNN